MASDNDIDSPVAESKTSTSRKRVVEVSLEESKRYAFLLELGPEPNL